MKITNNWKLQWFEPGEKHPLEIASPAYIDHFWMTTNVPGDVHTTLISKKIIEDPFVGHNDLKCRWVEEKEWWYRTTFEWQEELNEGEFVELIFEGLDTYATIYFNGVEIGSTENMFIEHEFEVTRELKKGKNVIAVKFDPVHIRVAGKERNYWCSYGKERSWIRKAAMNFGWDWGPRLVTVGIWKDVYLLKRKKAKLHSVFPKTVELTSELAIVEVEVETKSYYFTNETLTVEVLISSNQGSFSAYSVIDNKTGKVVVEVTNPILWWTHDLGQPYLYELKVLLKDKKNNILDQCSQLFGIRKIVIEQKHENGENLFAFNLNGIRLFAKGANWIPVHNFIGSVNENRYMKLLKLVKGAHMNMIRVWGGGIYEKDIFYETCDRLGILVWQDFMFANALYPDYNKNFMKNVREEVIKVIKRLRKYTSLALWCGNNEIDWIYERKKTDGEVTTPFYGETIYHQLIPELLNELDGTRFYWPSSPYGGNDFNSEDNGDRHNWQVWHGNVEPRKIGEPVIQNISVEGVSFKNYKKDCTRFSSEFGMHASSNRYTLKKYIPEGEFYWKSDEMAYRNKDHFHEKGILLMEGYTGIPTDMEEYIHYSMLTQAEGLKYGIEHYRRNKPFTSGALIWQLNDCWPGTSWSMIDYELLPKASYYYARKFFAPVTVTIDHDPGKPIHIWGINDKLWKIEDSLVVEVFHVEGKQLFSKQYDFVIEPNQVKHIASFSEKKVLRGAKPETVVLRLRSLNGRFLDNIYYLRDSKEMNYPKAQLQVSRSTENNTITIISDQLARFVTIDIPQEEVLCSDNFFDLLPGETKTIQLQHLSGKDIRIDEISVFALNSI
ncbi:beta-mannosidase [Anoxybacillus tepidamans]|uniref:Beta-mannosidase B n=1 Tax=Anoxybacteroides tepidamans TaxID=265948 RepID=A0A7W8IS43_9BACL|nr:glycoside hydrolase family 2 protein [Anoxybacillus tepidamans]MBB5325745.1 beta-mannosidase [Anoxybacillus tepidamans]